VRPLRVVLEGFTSFRERLEVDFSGLDLFAITGPTGAGKSSLIDAIVFALYGQVPRVGDDYKQLISHGADRLSVLFEFEVGGERFRIARTARRTGASQQRLERVTSGGVEAIADRAREIRTEVERVLGLDYDGFTRSVVLPQGQFDAFLKGEPKERRKILVALLGLGVYERMQQLANQKATAARAQSEFIRKQLETDYAQATPEALAEWRQTLSAAEAEEARTAAAAAKLAEGAAQARSVSTARREAETLARDEEAERRALSAAEQTLATADSRRAELAVQVESLAAQAAAAGFVEARHAVLLAAKPCADQLAALRPRLDKLAQGIEAREKTVEDARAALAVAETQLPGLQQEEAAAAAVVEQARTERDDLHRAHAAAALRQSLKAGEACPVCEQGVTRLPKKTAVKLESADAPVRAAEKALAAATAQVQDVKLKLAQLRTGLDGLNQQLRQQREQRDETRALAATASAELERLGFLAIETADAAGLAARLQDELKRLEAARRARAELAEKRAAAEKRRSALEFEVATAASKRDGARGRLGDLGTRRGDAQARLAASRAQLLALAAAEGWPGLDRLPAGRDEADAVEALRAAAQRACAQAAAGAATARQTVERVSEAIDRAAALRDERTTLDASGARYREVSDHLKANEIVAWIQEEALRRLAREGSRHLARLSQARYELRLGSGEGEPASRAEQDFYVIDHWNGDSVRSVRTLSGGETFLASLALALALAESLAELSSEGRAQDALESLFLDEGFGTLDGETLETVVSALDALHGGRRVVGIVTHVRELAERLPDRLEVRRQGTASTAVVA
jgi:exonuclease SbcC